MPEYNVPKPDACATRLCTSFALGVLVLHSLLVQLIRVGHVLDLRLSVCPVTVHQLVAACVIVPDIFCRWLSYPLSGGPHRSAFVVAVGLRGMSRAGGLAVGGAAGADGGVAGAGEVGRHCDQFLSFPLMFFLGLFVVDSKMFVHSCQVGVALYAL